MISDWAHECHVPGFLSRVNEIRAPAKTLASLFCSICVVCADRDDALRPKSWSVVPAAASLALALILGGHELTWRAFLKSIT